VWFVSIVIQSMKLLNMGGDDMFGLRNEIRSDTQEAYGHYCSYARSKNKEPVPYHLFSDYFLLGLSVKEIYRKLNSED
jgi:hypothetical protein